MTPKPPNQSLTPEQQRSTENPSTASQNNNLIISLLHQSYQYQQIFNQEFQIKESQTPQSDKPLSRLITYLETITPESSSKPPFKPSSIEDYYHLPPSLFISYLETLSLPPEKKQSIIEGWLCHRLLEVKGLKIQELSFSDKKIHYLKKPNQLTAILKEIQEIGSLEDWDTFYRFAQNLSEISDLQELDNFDKNLETQKKLLSQSEENQEKLYQRLIQLSQRKRQFLSPQPLKTEQDKTQPNPKELIRKYKEQLEQALSYLEWAYHTKSRLKTLPEFIIRLLQEYRNLRFTPTPETYRLTELFWALRLNRQIDLSRFPPLIAKITERFFKTILDEALQTEQAGFWLERNLQIPLLSVLLSDRDTNKQLENRKKAISPIIESLVPLIQSLPNFQNREVIYINVNFDDLHIYKLKIDLKSDKLSDQIKAQIEEALSQPINLSQDPYQVFTLRQQAYDYEPIDKKSKDFRESFAHQRERKILGFLPTPFSETINDDFIIRINTRSQDSSSNPTSLFMVEHHHALLNFDIHPQGIKISGKFAHRHFDGIPAKNFFNDFIENLRSRFENSTEIPLNIIEESFYQSSLPVFESSARKVLSDILAEPKGKFNPTLIYALATAIGNDIDHFHFLVNGPDIFSKDGPYSNVQPAVISLLPIKDIIKKIKNGETLNDEEKNKIKEWQEKTLAEIERAKKGFSTPAVIAAPAGTKQKGLSKISERLYHAVRLLTQSQGMFSGIPDLKPRKLQETAFYTAQSDSYHLRINLENPQSSMGVIGFNQSQEQKGLNLLTELVFTVRKNPSQAQKELRYWFDENFGEDKKLLKKFEKLINNWDSLIRGKLSLENYLSSLESFFQSLPEEKRKELESKEKIQEALNHILFQSAENSLAAIEENIHFVEQLLSV